VIPQPYGNKINSSAWPSIRSYQEDEMVDDKSKRDFRDRNRVSADEDCQVEYFARENGVTIEQVRELIKANGNDREALIEAARILRERK
jgi:DNA-binding transcriptional MerR regulator